MDVHYAPCARAFVREVQIRPERPGNDFQSGNDDCWNSASKNKAGVDSASNRPATWSANNGERVAKTAGTERGTGGRNDQRRRFGERLKGRQQRDIGE